MDARIPLFLLFSAVFAYWAWSANKSGDMTVRWTVLHRNQRPVLFAINWWMTVAFSVAGLIAASAVAFGWI
jgi:hypothetical protein